MVGNDLIFLLQENVVDQRRNFTANFLAVYEHIFIIIQISFAKFLRTKKRIQLFMRKIIIVIINFVILNQIVNAYFCAPVKVPVDDPVLRHDRQAQAFLHVDDDLFDGVASVQHQIYVAHDHLEADLVHVRVRADRPAVHYEQPAARHVVLVQRQNEGVRVRVVAVQVEGLAFADQAVDSAVYVVVAEPEKVRVFLQKFADLDVAFGKKQQILAAAAAAVEDARAVFLAEQLEIEGVVVQSEPDVRVQVVRNFFAI